MNINVDIINGLFELFGGCLLLLNILRLHKDKCIKGVSWTPVAFFTSWGFWNLYYYPSLEQWFSFFGGLFIVFINSIWLIQVFYYNKKKKEKEYGK